MGIYNLNPRRVVWFSPNEPSNKYDIWLSRNAHLDENGEPTTDSNSQRDCDYIFKIYDCGKWNPIVGFNTTAANKINTVASADGYQENHVPLFGNPDNSPDELVDGGTIGDVLYHHMTESDWEHIIESGGLGTAITEYSTENPFHLGYAGHQIVGGIWADRFTMSYNDTSAVNKTYLAQAKYKYQQTASDYNLYVHARDIMLTIQHYTEDHGDEPGFPSIIPPNIIPEQDVPTILYNWFVHSRSIKKDWNPQQSQSSADKPHFSIWGANNPQNAGKLLRMRPDAATWEQTITGPYSEDNNILDWVSPDDLFDDYHYELPLASLRDRGGIRAGIHSNPGLSYTYLAECKLNPLQPEVGHEYSAEALFIDVRDVKQALDNWYANNDSTVWDLNIGSGYGINTIKLQTYNPNTGVTSDRYTHILDGYTNSTKQGLFCRTKYYENGNAFGNHQGLEWVEAQTIVEEGLGIGTGNAGYLYYNGSDFYLDSGTGGGGGGSVDLPPYLQRNNCNIQGEKIIYVPREGTGGNTKYLNGYGEWSTPPNTTYNDFSGSTHGLVPASTAASQNKYLKGDGTWGTPSVNANFNINLATSFTSDGDFILNNLQLSSHSTENPISTQLGEWNYYNINGGNKTSQFTFSNTHNSGNAIYIRFYTGLHSVSINTDADIIFSNEVMSSSRRQFAANSSYLITIQFGIIKIEKITVNSNSSDS